jgi:predicted N-acetyltransferase YhbS
VKVAVPDGTPAWYGLGPVSGLPEYQRQGIGKTLLEEGLPRLRDLRAPAAGKRADLIAVTGNPPGDSAVMADVRPVMKAGMVCEH